MNMYQKMLETLFFIAICQWQMAIESSVSNDFYPRF